VVGWSPLFGCWDELMGVGRRRAINDFQKGETRTFIKHIEAGVSIALQNPETLLVFSGYVLSWNGCSLRTPANWLSLQR
jgi:hypothetical protein